MNTEDLEQKLLDLSGIKDGVAYSQFVKTSNNSIMTIRDALLLVSEIIEEDLEEEYYIASLQVGNHRRHTTYLAARRVNSGVHLAAADRKGKQGANRCTEALLIAVDSLNGKPRKPKRANMKLRLILLIMLFAGLIAAIWFQLLLPHCIVPLTEASIEYNGAIDDFNAYVPTYNSTAEKNATNNLKGFVTVAEPLSKVSTNTFDIARSFFMGNNADKTRRDCMTVCEMKQRLEACAAALTRINNPNKTWVIERLSNVEEIDQCMAVDDDNDPNEMLNKPHGYTSCIYFTSKLIDLSKLTISDPVQMGVDAGGAIEVYDNVEDARNRCEYLAGFNDSILDSGSYAPVGTMVIRTSCLLDDDGQYYLTDKIVRALIQLEDTV